MTKTKTNTKTVDHSVKRLARLAAVQGLYQIALTERSAKDIISDFHAHPPELLKEDVHFELGDNINMDDELFGSIVTGVMQDTDDLDGLLSGALDGKLSMARLEILLRAILRAGTYEIQHHRLTPQAVIINDYVDVAHAFFNDKEPGMVNAVLDRVAKNIR